MIHRLTDSTSFPRRFGASGEGFASQAFLLGPWKQTPLHSSQTALTTQTSEVTSADCRYLICLPCDRNLRVSNLSGLPSDYRPKLLSRSCLPWYVEVAVVCFVTEAEALMMCGRAGAGAGTVAVSLGPERI